MASGKKGFSATAALVVMGVAVAAAAGYQFGLLRASAAKSDPTPSETGADTSPVVREPAPTFRDVFRELGRALRLAGEAAAAAWTAFCKFVRVSPISALLSLIVLAAVGTMASSEITEAIHISHSAPAWAAWFIVSIVVAGRDHFLRIAECLILVARWAAMKPYLVGLSVTATALAFGLPAS